MQSSKTVGQTTDDKTTIPVFQLEVNVKILLSAPALASPYMERY